MVVDKNGMDAGAVSWAGVGLLEREWMVLRAGRRGAMGGRKTAVTFRERLCGVGHQHGSRRGAGQEEHRIWHLAPAAGHE
jgi:hypothetical protein